MSEYQKRHLPGALLIAATLLLSLSATPWLTSYGQSKPKPKPAAKAVAWEAFGRDVMGSHHNPDETILTPANVGQLKPKWTFTTEGDVSSQPLLINGVLYFGSWDGNEYAVDAKTGAKLWAYDAGQSSRAAAAYGEGLLFFGDVAGILHAVDAKTGALKWKKKIDPHPATMATSSPIYHQGRVYIGVSSREEMAVLGKRDYQCCTFRGSIVAYDAKTGDEAWRFYVIPDEAKEQGKDKAGVPILGPAGGSVWSTVTLDPASKRLYATTGNQYTQPAAKNINSILALDLTNGKLLWSYEAMPRKDIWTMGCRNNPECDDLDFDFGSAPVFVKGPGGKKLVVAGQKSGWAYGVDVATGKLVWSTEVGTPGKLGGIEFGLASDGERIYAGISNAGNKDKQGWVSALDGATGKVLWKTVAPDGGSNFGPITVSGKGANRLVWAGSSKNHVYAYNAADGKILWEFDTGGGVGGGLTVVDGTVYVGSGYTMLRIGKANNKLYAFSLEGK